MILGIRRSLYNKLPQGYITDGLVFELNASKGLSEDGWIEQISGKKFTWTDGSEKVFSVFGVEIGSTVGTNGSFMQCENSTFTWTAMSECTMDICFEWGTKEVNSQVFNFGIDKGFAFQVQGNGQFYHCGVPSKGCWMYQTASKYGYRSRIVMNYSNSSLIADKVSTTRYGIYPNRSTASKVGSMAMLGRNADGTYPCSKVIIRAIRIYNRPLTSEEIVQNYTTDTAVFNLQE